MLNFLHTFSPTPILISFGQLHVYWYGLFIVLGVLAALTVSLKLSKKLGLSPNKIFDLAFWMIIAGIIGARIYHVFLEWGYYSQDYWSILKVWQGGLAIHGAIIAGIVLGSLAAKTRSIYAGFLVHITVALSMDLLALWHRHALPTIFMPVLGG